ncbi:phosphoenolpyruvate--protein phosphotransferase [Brevibacterium sp. p3-SID960]|uniref:phosphoenolpyruvate--protein phosphotransferase n=1 Tax=Brevibacterium sp. p3-SID960 TaxID=2916063 RepID=UPI0021A8B7FE|nr:phosphoenolpyruvate--protein phosphotransferase [Brevibacterium sp. p3-SID960]MCT1689794.1 phosphoenolpyruvate--protein phosphotransferase [Brevibacterium sp. p3-SID960]
MRGIGASEGCALGPVHHVDRSIVEPSAEQRPTESDPAAEVTRFTEATGSVAAALETAAASASGEAAEILSATAQMASDPALATAAAGLIRDENLTAERAAWVAAGQLRERLERLGGYLGERAADVADVRDRIIASLRGEHSSLESPDEPFVLVAESLSPADTADLDTTLVLALVTVQGGPQSHSAILARALGIPAVVGTDPAITELAAGTEVFVDGTAGTITTEPGDEEKDRAAQWRASRAETSAFSGRGALACGHRVRLMANIGSAADAEAAAQAGAEGIGLLRTEFLFLDRDDEPSVEEQAEAYAAIFAHFPHQPVVIRTLDAGSDKPMPFITAARRGDAGSQVSEPNPALGMRGFRTHSFAPQVLERQLQAIAQAAQQSDAEVKVMAPMITTAEEAARFAQLVTAVGLPTAGIMVETPAAALCANATLVPVAFASIGTNDLTQYTSAFDRELPDYGGLQSSAHPAVLSLISATVRGAEQAEAQAADGTQRTVGVCGEAAADPRLAVILAGLGVTSLSMSAPALGRVATQLSEVTLAEARAAAAAALEGSVVTAPAAASDNIGADSNTADSSADAEAPAASGAEALHAPTASGAEEAEVRRTIEVTAPTGLHARPAAVLAKALKALDARVRITHAASGSTADGSSVMEMMALGADSGDTIEIHATGPAAAEAVDAVEAAATGDA